MPIHLTETALIGSRPDTAGMVGNPESPKPLFWLTYRHDGRAAGVVVIESRSGLLRARLKVALAGADRGLEFVSAHQLHQESAGQIPANMMSLT
jgi:hypothetical protein